MPGHVTFRLRSGGSEPRRWGWRASVLGLCPSAVSLLCHAYLEIHLEVSTVTYRYSWDSWVPATFVKTESGICAEKAQTDTFFLLPFSIIPYLHLIDFFVGNWGYVLLLAAGVVMNQASRTSVAKAEVLGNFAWRTHVRKLPGSGERPKPCHAQRSNGSCFLGGTLFMLCRFLLGKAMSAIIGCLWSWTNTWVECLCLPGTSPALVHRSHSATCHRNWLSPISVNRMNLFPSLLGPRALTHCGENGILARLCRSKPMEWMGYSAS